MRCEGISLFVMHLALGGCLGLPPVRFGITADTGGHIAYVIEAAQAQAALRQVRKVSVVTRLFDDVRLGPEYAMASQRLNAKTTIDRIATANRTYLEKGALALDLPAFVEAFCRHLDQLAALPDVIHAHFADAAFVAQAARTKFAIPFVYTPHALGIDKRNQNLADATLGPRIASEREAILTADAMIVSTRNEMERQVAAYNVPGSRQIRCLAPGVPQATTAVAQSSAMVSLADWLDDTIKPIVLAIARPVRKKNLAALIRAYSATPLLMAKANLVILAGQHGYGLLSGEEHDVVTELKTLCDQPSLRGRVALPPRHNAADVAALYRQASAGGVFVNPALHEPFGLTLIEAAEVGLPVVATCAGGPADIIAATGHGLLIDPRNEAQIGAACLRIVSDPVLHGRFAQAARDNVHKFSWSRYAKASVSLYASLRPGFHPQIAGRLLASDIDGTLTGCRSGARSFTQWHTTSNLPFVVATGRSFAAACAVLAEWGLPRPDAFIVDVGTRIMLPQAGGIWAECRDYAVMLDVDWDREAVAAILAPLGLTPQALETDGPHKLSFIGSVAQMQSIRDALEKAGLAARVIFSHGRLIDVLAPHAGKAAALAFYAAQQGLTLDDCIAAGDSGNDGDMLQACGCAIVVGNAGPELDDLPPRPGLMRVSGHYANGVMEGLAAFGVKSAQVETAAA